MEGKIPKNKMRDKLGKLEQDLDECQQQAKELHDQAGGHKQQIGELKVSAQKGLQTMEKLLGEIAECKQYMTQLEAELGKCEHTLEDGNARMERMRASEGDPVTA